MDNFIPTGRTVRQGQPVQPVPAVSEETASLVSIGQYLLLIGAIIDITTKNDRLSIFAASVKLLAIGLFITAAFREIREQQISPGSTTAANREKIIGSLTSLAAALILFDALLREVRIRRATGIAQLSIPVSVGGTGAFAL